MKKIKILAMLIVSLLLFWNLNAFNVGGVDSIDKNTIKVVLSDDTKLEAINTKDLKILEDLKIKESLKDSVEKNKITLFLEKELERNSNYSIISVWLAEWNIEFAILDNIIGEYKNLSTLKEERKIDKVNIVNSSTIELYYNYDIKEWSYDFKFLNELIIDEVKENTEAKNTLDVNLLSLLNEDANYILMISSDDEELELNDLLYDFKFVNPEENTENTDNEVIINEIDTENNVDNENTEDNIENKTEEIKEEPKDKDLEKVALDATTIPQTGPALWITLLLTFVIAWVFVLRTRKS